MQKQEKHNFGLIYYYCSKSFYDHICEKEPELVQIVISNRMAKKICRKCYRRLPLNSNVCRGCKNPDLRTKKEYNLYNLYFFDKNTKNKLVDKRNVAL